MEGEREGKKQRNKETKTDRKKISCHRKKWKIQEKK